MKAKELKKELGLIPDEMNIEISISFDSSEYPHLRCFSDEFLHHQITHGDCQLLFTGSLNDDFERDDEQFGQAWEKEMMKKNKKELISHFRKCLFAYSTLQRKP